MQEEEGTEINTVARANKRKVGDYIEPDTIFLLVVTLICACYWLV